MFLFKTQTRSISAAVKARSRTLFLCSLVAIIASVVVVGSAAGQSAVAVAESGSTALTLRTAQSQFIISKANTAQEAIKDTAISTAGTQVAQSVAGIAGGKLLTLPGGIGGLPVIGALGAIGTLRKKTVKGFSVEFLNGLSAETVLPHGTLSFNIDTGQSKLQSSAVQLFGPILLRVQGDTKDSTRILRTIHVSYKEPGGSPMDSVILGIEEQPIALDKQDRGGDQLALTPRQLLDPGEYVIVLPTRTAAIGGHGLYTLTWDFRVQ